MSKTKTKNGSEVEYLKGEIRRLKRQLRRYEKTYSNRQPIIKKLEKIKETLTPKDTRIECSECGKGRYDEFYLMEKIYGTCDVCGNRKKLHG